MKTVVRGEETLHVAELPPLRPGGTYSYSVRSGSEVSQLYTFQTLPAGVPFDFAAWADMHNQSWIFSGFVQQMQSLPVAFTVSVGDMVVDGGYKQPWIDLFEVLRPLAAQVPTMFVGGNHEYDWCFDTLRSGFFERYARTTPNAHFYAWTAGNARFVALDPNICFPTGIPVGSAQRAWFMRELESHDWRQARWHFIFIHQPPYSQGWTDYHGDPPIRAMLDPLVERYGMTSSSPVTRTTASA